MRGALQLFFKVIFLNKKADRRCKRSTKATKMTAIDCLIFDIDDTLYPITNGFTNHRLKEVAIDFMRAKLGAAARQ